MPNQQPYPGVMNIEAPQSVYDQLLTEANKERNQHDKDRARASEPTDLDFPEGVDELIIGDNAKIYRRQREQEKEMDAIILRTYARYRELVKQPRTQLCCLGQEPGAFVKLRQRTLRISIFNTAKNQPWESKELDDGAFDFNSGVDSTYRVTIRGTMLPSDDKEEAMWKSLEEGIEERYKDDASDQEELSPEEAKEYEFSAAYRDENGEMHWEKTRKKKPIRPKDPKLSQLFKRIFVEYERPKELQPDGFKAVEWTKPEGLPAGLKNLPRAADFGDLNFERKGDENMNVTINLFRDEQPEYFKLSKELEEICMSTEATREEIVWGLWEYIKYFELPRDDENRRITCDENFKNVSFPPAVSRPRSTSTSPLANNRHL